MVVVDWKVEVIYDLLLPQALLSQEDRRGGGFCAVGAGGRREGGTSWIKVILPVLGAG